MYWIVSLLFLVSERFEIERQRQRNHLAGWIASQTGRIHHSDVPQSDDDR